MDKMYFKHMARYLGLAIVVLLLGSCGAEKTLQEDTVLQPRDEFRSFTLDLNADATKFFELIESIEITRLEETEESLLGNVRQIEFYQDKMIVPGIEGNIYVFNDQGDFVKRINRKGDGPEEYSGWNDVWLEQDQINLYVFRKGVLKYDFDGNYIATDPIDAMPTHIHPFNGGYAMDMNFSLINDSLKYGVAVLDANLEVDRLHLPFSVFPDFGISTPSKTVFPIGDDVFVFPIMEDTVYQLTKDSIKPIIHYDFGEDWFFQPGVELTSNVMVDASRENKVWLMSNRIGQQFISLYAIAEERSARFFINRSTGKSIKLGVDFVPEENFLISGIIWDGNDFLFTTQSSHLEYLLSNLEESQYKFIGDASLEVIESSENPVLIRMKLKDNLDW